MKIYFGKYPSSRSKKQQKINIHIDEWDVWNMESTLAMIIAPMLRKLKEIKHGAPYVDDNDVPEELRSNNSKKSDDYGLDENFFKRWDWVLDEMIWTFEQLAAGGNEEQFFHTPDDLALDFDASNIEDQIRQIKVDEEGLSEHNRRIENGLRLFAKYYRNLWD